MKCDKCHGTGDRWNGVNQDICPRCNGTGAIVGITITVDELTQLQTTLAEHKLALELACQTCVDICTIDDGCSKCPLQTDEINDCGRNHIPTADQFHKKLLTQARVKIKEREV